MEDVEASKTRRQKRSSNCRIVFLLSSFDTLLLTSFLRPPPPPPFPSQLNSTKQKQLPAIGVDAQFVTFTNTTMESDKFICIRETGAQVSSWSFLWREGGRRRREDAKQRPRLAPLLLDLALSRPLPQLTLPRSFLLAPLIYQNAPLEPKKNEPQNSVVIVDMASPMTPTRRPITADSALMNPSSKVIALKASVAGAAGDSLQVFDLETKAKVKSFQIAQPVSFWRWVSPSKLGVVTASSVYHWDAAASGGDPVKVFDRALNLENTQVSGLFGFFLLFLR